MASSGSFSGSIYSGHYKLRIDWTQAADQSTNTSTITANIYLVNDYSLNIGSIPTNYITIDGTKHSFTSPAISTTGTHLLGTAVQTVSHASDGSKSLDMYCLLPDRLHAVRHLLSVYHGIGIGHAGYDPESVLRQHGGSGPRHIRSGLHQQRLRGLYAHGDLFHRYGVRNYMHKDIFGFSFLDTAVIDSISNAQLDLRHLCADLYDLQRKHTDRGENYICHIESSV